MGCLKLTYNNPENPLKVVRDPMTCGEKVVQGFMRMDPMSEMYRAFSPYNYTLNNPVKLIDPNGMWVESSDGYSTDDPDEIKKFLNQAGRYFHLFIIDFQRSYSLSRTRFGRISHG